MRCALRPRPPHQQCSQCGTAEYGQLPRRNRTNRSLWNEFLHRILFASRSRYFQKLRILSETLQNLTREYNDACEDVAAGISVQPGDSWDKLECPHYDFTTCLREAEVLVKSFLRSLPGEQLQAFAAELDAVPVPEKHAISAPRTGISRVPA